VAARRCTQCGLNWPTDTKYMDCPSCQGSTWWCNESDAMEKKAADARVKRLDDERAAAQAKAELTARFNEWYAEREAATFWQPTAFDHAFCDQHGISLA